MCRSTMEECLVCFEETNQFQVFTCGHKVCVYCYPRLRSTKCPVCSQTIELLPGTYHVPKSCCCLLVSLMGIVVYSLLYW